jgi:ribosome modulation factor
MGKKPTEWSHLRISPRSIPRVYYPTPEKRKLLVAEKLGRKHRNNGNTRAENPYDKGDPCRYAWFKGWRQRDKELLGG